LIDFAGWQEIPERYSDRPFHPHNRLIVSAGLNGEERRETAREIAKRLRASDTPAHVILTNKGIEEWDKEGGPAHDPEAFDAFCDEMRTVMTDPIAFTELDCHINDQAFADKALEIFDNWTATAQSGAIACVQNHTAPCELGGRHLIKLAFETPIHGLLTHCTA